MNSVRVQTTGLAQVPPLQGRAAPEPIGQYIGRYIVEGILGRGGQSTVFRARDEKLKRTLAIKVFSGDAGDLDLRRRFQLEAQTIARLDHPNIVRCVDFSDPDSTMLFLAMEYAAGQSLDRFVAQRGILCEQAALCVGYQVTKAVEYAHQHGVLHRDIKSSNVILSGGRAILVDFGGVKEIETCLGLNSVKQCPRTVALGTPGFMAPEQYMGRKVTERSDLFGVAALLYHLTTDAVPYQGEDAEETFQQARRGRYRDPRTYQPLLTPAFCDLLGDCLEVRPADRLSSASLLLQRIEELMVAHGVVDPQATLAAFEEQPDGLTAELEARSVQKLVTDLGSALLRSLRVATRERKSSEAKVIVRRLQFLTQLNRLSHDTSPSAASTRKVMMLSGRGRHKRGYWWGSGCLAGILLTLAVAWATWHAGLLLPPHSMFP